MQMLAQLVLAQLTLVLAQLVQLRQMLVQLSCAALMWQ